MQRQKSCVVFHDKFRLKRYPSAKDVNGNSRKIDHDKNGNDFYRQLGKKEPLADALRAAQLHLLREGYPPYVWAAFVLTGKY